MSAHTKEDAHHPLRAEAQAVLDTLTERQTEVLDLAAVPGKPSNKDIARELDISPSMVDKHMQNARVKLNTNSRPAALTRYAVYKALTNSIGSSSGHLQIDPEIIEKVLRDLPSGEALELLSSEDFQQFLADIRSKGPKAWTARYGWGWKPVAALFIALVIVALLISGIELADYLDQLNAPEPS